jgi:hypothetical protein
VVDWSRWEDTISVHRSFHCLELRGLLLPLRGGETTERPVGLDLSARFLAAGVKFRKERAVSSSRSGLGAHALRSPIGCRRLGGLHAAAMNGDRENDDREPDELRCAEA